MGRKYRESTIFKALTRFGPRQPVQLEDKCRSCEAVHREHGIRHITHRYSADTIADLLEVHSLSVAEVARRGGIDRHHLLACLNWEELFTKEDAFSIEYATARHIRASKFPSARLQREQWWSLVRAEYEKQPPTPWPRHPIKATYKWSQRRRLANRRKIRKQKGRDRFFNRPAHEAPTFAEESVTVCDGGE